jgi:hypothetical protein
MIGIPKYDLFAVVATKFFKKLFATEIHGFPYVAIEKHFSSKCTPIVEPLSKLDMIYHPQIIEICLEYPWCKLHLSISSKNTNLWQDQLLYKVYKFAGYKFTQFVQSPTFETSYAFAVFFSDFA